MGIIHLRRHLKNIWQIVQVRSHKLQVKSSKFQSYIICLGLLIALVGCSGRNNAGIQRIALLAPFEGRNSEIGYDAYYAVRLAIQEHGNDNIELLAIDDGGSSASAMNRAKALASDPL